MTTVNTEAELYAPIWKGANAEGWALFRMQDGSVGKAPGDIAGTTNEGFAVLVEVKVIRRRRPDWRIEAPHWPSYETHQSAWLRRYAEAHALAIAVEHDASTRETSAYVVTAAHGDHRPMPRVILEAQYLNDRTWVLHGWWKVAQAHRNLRPYIEVRSSTADGMWPPPGPT